jgi:hypothetical protein
MSFTSLRFVANYLFILSHLRPPLTFRSKLASYIEMLVLHTTRTAPCRLSATAYSINLQPASSTHNMQRRLSRDGRTHYAVLYSLYSGRLAESRSQDLPNAKCRLQPPTATVGGLAVLRVQGPLSPVIY